MIFYLIQVHRTATYDMICILIDMGDWLSKANLYLSSALDECEPFYLQALNLF